MFVFFKKVSGLLLMSTIVALLASLGISSVCAKNTGSDEFTNPISTKGADPYVTYHDGYYYAMKTENPLTLYRSKVIQDVYKSEDKIIIDTTNVQPGWIWAPEIHFWNDKAYIYLSINNGNQTAVLESVTSDPMGQYEEKNHNLPGIDWSLYQQKDGTLWGLTADWNGGDGIKIAEMINPYTLKTDPTIIVSVTEPWEQEDNSWVEGPFIFEREGKIFLCYSAGGWTKDTYAIGLSTFSGNSNDRLDDSAKWVKSKTPVFQSANGVTGTGHNSIVRTADGTEYWNVYHNHPYSGTENREISMDLITWNDDGTPNFSVPTGSYIRIKAPSSLPPADSLVITSQDTVTIGSTISLKADILPTNAPQTVKWSVAPGTGKAEIKDNILVPISAGTVTITATSANEVTDTMTITITIKDKPVPTDTTPQSSSALPESNDHDLGISSATISDTVSDTAQNTQTRSDTTAADVLSPNTGDNTLIILMGGIILLIISVKIALVKNAKI